MSKQLQSWTREQVAEHRTEGDLWVIIDSKVYDLSKFAPLHPGGFSVLLDPEIAGQDATEMFYGLHRFELLEQPKFSRFIVGSVVNQSPTLHGKLTGTLSDVPYAEPPWLSKGYHSPYYTENHRQFQKAVRQFVDTILYPDAQALQEGGKRISQSVLDEMTKINMHAMRMGPGPHLKGLKLMNGIVKPEEFDYFHEMILDQELVRCADRGYADGMQAGNAIGLPPLLNFGSEALKKRIVPEVLSCKKSMCLAISEAFAGSDINSIRTTAVKSEDGKFWIVNGSKKWITNGTFADYFTVGCKTASGFTVILIERSEGLSTKHIKTPYSSAAGTAYVTFDNVKVPVENTLGKEGGGIFVILSNFNHERWVLCVVSVGAQRMVLEECLKWVNQRKVFGKPLSSLASVRSRLAQMIARVEATHTWLENITYQMCNMSYKQQADKLAGQIALLKMYSTQAASKTAEDATQIFGGRGITQSGMGRFIEHYRRTVAYDALLGGTEDVMADLGVRQAFRTFPPGVRL